MNKQKHANRRTARVIYATLSGDAEQVAKDTVDVLGEETLGPTELAEVGVEELEQPQDILFVVSTYNWGEPPGDTYRWFEKHIWPDVYHTELIDWKKLNLRQLRFSIVALGDKSYGKEFCLFGKNLNVWLKSCGAGQIGELVLVDRCAEGDLQHWFTVAKHHWNLIQQGPKAG